MVDIIQYMNLLFEWNKLLGKPHNNFLPFYYKDNVGHRANMNNVHFWVKILFLNLTMYKVQCHLKF